MSDDDKECIRVCNLGECIEATAIDDDGRFLVLFDGKWWEPAIWTG